MSNTSMSRIATLLAACFGIISWAIYNGYPSDTLDASTLSLYLSPQNWISIITTGAPPLSCTPTAFPFPSLFGIEFISRTASPIRNYSTPVGGPNVGFYAESITSLDLCNVSMTYTHPGQNDLITVSVTLPLTRPAWNGRFLAGGGGGFVTGDWDSQIGAVVEGFASATTDGGHTTDPGHRPTWGLISEGNTNYALLHDFASLSLVEMVRIGKAITKSYYHAAPKYSYWAGCSTGGRQGMLIAQRYPNDIDGILAVAPAINLAEFVTAMFWPQLIMHNLGIYSHACELDGITNAAIAACDGLDGLTDGIVSAPDLCTFNASSMIDQTIPCPSLNHNIRISAAAAEVAQKSWQGLRSTTGAFLWHGLTQSTTLTRGLASTVCDASGTHCTGAPPTPPFSIPWDWISIFVEKRADLDLTKLTHADLDRIFRKASQELHDAISTADTDLSAFRAAGGKLISWHGLDDQLIFPNGSARYYDAVEARDTAVRDFFRYFEAPGLEHCYYGNGFFPNGSMASLMEWVEHGVAPEMLEGTALWRPDGEVHTRPLCVYPLVARYVGGDPKVSASFRCEESYT